MSKIDTKSKIVDAAIKNISLYGHDGATMKKIADDSDIKTASICYFFQNKQELMLSVLDRVLKNHFQAMEKTYDLNKGFSPLITMNSMLGEIATHHFENEDERKVYLELLESSDVKIKKEVSDYLERYNSWLYNNLLNELTTLHRTDDGENLKQILDYFLLIGNGVFWGTNLYTREKLEMEVRNAKKLMTYAYNEVLNYEEE